MQRLLIETKKTITGSENSNIPLSECNLSNGIYRQEISVKSVVRIPNLSLGDFININLLSVKDSESEIKAIVQSDVYLTGISQKGTDETTFEKHIKLEGIANHVSQGGGNREHKVMFNSLCEAEELSFVGFTIKSDKVDGRKNLIQYVRDEVLWSYDDFGLEENNAQAYIELTFYTTALIGAFQKR